MLRIPAWKYRHLIEFVSVFYRLVSFALKFISTSVVLEYGGFKVKLFTKCQVLCCVLFCYALFSLCICGFLMAMVIEKRISIRKNFQVTCNSTITCTEKRPSLR